MKNKYIIAAVCAAIIFAAGLMTGIYAQKRAYSGRVETRTDTTYIYVDRPVLRPSLASEMVLDAPVVTRPLLVVVKDADGTARTDTIVEQLPRTQKLYEGADCKVWASGYDVAVDSVQVRQKVVTITNNNVVHDNAVRRWAVYATGCGRYDGTILGGVGGGIEWRPASWAHIYAEAGYRYDMTRTGAPYAQIGARIDIIRFGGYGKR